MSKLARFRALPAALAVVGGAAFGLCFGIEPSPWLPWVALIPLFALLGRRRRFLLGWLHGIAFWLVSMSWIYGTLVDFGGLSPALGVLCQLLLALYLGFDQAVFAWLAGPVWRRGGGWALSGVAALWALSELARGALFGGFPWNLGAYAWVAVPGPLPLSAWIGPFGVSFLLAFANGGFAQGLMRRRVEPALVGLLVPLTLFFVASRFSQGAEDSSPQGLPVRLIQPSSSINKPDPEHLRESYGWLLETSRQACQAGSLVVWPESAAWPLSYDLAPGLRADLARLAEQGCAVVLNSSIREGDATFNAALLIDSSGLRARYDKRHLVPYGEYVPLSEVLPFIGTLARGVGGFTPGHEATLLPFAGEKLGMSICYEIVFPGAVAAQVRQGATVLMTVTNDGWYGDTAAPWQHFRAAQFRAAENRRPMLRAALTGVSGTVDARGRIAQKLGVGERGVLVERGVRGSRGLSPYSRAPWLVPWLAALLASFAILRARPWNDRKRRKEASDATH